MGRLCLTMCRLPPGSCQLIKQRPLLPGSSVDAHKSIGIFDSGYAVAIFPAINVIYRSADLNSRREKRALCTSNMPKRRIICPGSVSIHWQTTSSGWLIIIRPASVLPSPSPRLSPRLPLHRRQPRTLTLRRTERDTTLGPSDLVLLMTQRTTKKMPKPTPT
jgi:hypothetical protein